MPQSTDRRVQRTFVSTISATSQRNGAGFNPCQGLYHVPSGTQPKTAFIASHYNVDFSEHYLGPLLAAQGYGFLGWNTRFRGNEPFFILEHALLDIAAGVAWLREEAGVEQVVLLGNSGGGSLMAAYQSQATRPALRGAQTQLPEALDCLPPADLYISLNAHGGRPEVLTAWFDPAITDESDPASTDPALSMYTEANGPPYSAEFLDRYRAAQIARNERITDWALAELDRLATVGIKDRAFNLYRTWADPRLLDGNIDPSDRQVGICYAGEPRSANYSPRGIGLTNTLRTWLSMWSLRTSPCRGAPHLNNIQIPALVIQSMADTGVFPSDAEGIYAELASTDKRLEFIAGDHYLTSPDNARDHVTELISAWTAAH